MSRASAKEPRPAALRRIEFGWYRVDGVACGLACAYCVTGENRAAGIDNRFRDGRPADADAILAAVEDVLARTPRDEPVHLTADDLLELDCFPRILAAFARHGRRLELVTPGLRLADREFARAVARHDVHFTVTYLAHSAATYEAVTRTPGAHEKVLRALANLQRFRIPFAVNCVVTRLNCGELGDVARFLLEDVGLDGFALPYLYLEQALLERNPRAAELYAPFPELDRQLAAALALCARPGRRRSIFVIDVPPCQLSAAVLASPHVKFQFVHRPDAGIDSPTPAWRDPACARCRLDDRCVYLPEHYRRAHPGVAVHPARIDALFGSRP